MSASRWDLERIRDADPDGGPVRPTAADHARFERWITDTFGPGVVAEYRGWGRNDW